jgi:predicted MPP superfamily phosphohydrolase
MKKKIKWLIAALALVLLAALVLWIAWENEAVELNSHRLTSASLPQGFDGFRIAHVSDFHNATLGEGNEKVLNLLRRARPDIIVITGDLIDSRKTDIPVSLSFVSEAMKIAPCYYAPGNHEGRIRKYPEFRASLLEMGVIVLEDSSVTLERGGDVVTLLGIVDPRFETKDEDLFSAVAEAKTETVMKGVDTYSILLAHRPEYFDLYRENGADLIFSGHVHGGQFRLPFLGGVYASDQGLFPQYDSGVYTEGDASMVVSRGIGNSSFPFRFNNPPEVLLVELYRSE